MHPLSPPEGSRNSHSVSDDSIPAYLSPSQQAEALTPKRLRQLGLPSKTRSATINAMALLWQFWLPEEVCTQWKLPTKAYMRIGVLGAMITKPAAPCPFKWLDSSKLPAHCRTLTHAAVRLLSNVPLFRVATLVMPSFFAEDQVNLPQGATWPEDHPMFNVLAGTLSLSIHRQCAKEGGEEREQAAEAYARLVASINSLDCDNELKRWHQDQQQRDVPDEPQQDDAAAVPARDEQPQLASPLRADDTEHGFHLQECVTALAAHRAQQIAQGLAAQSIQERKRLLQLYAEHASKQRDAAVKALHELEQLEQQETYAARKRSRSSRTTHSEDVDYDGEQYLEEGDGLQLYGDDE